MKEILLQGGPLNRCTLCRTEREEEYKQEKQVLFCPLAVTSPSPPFVRLSHLQACVVGHLRGAVREGDCWTSGMPGFRWPNVRGFSQIHFSFSTWSQIFETENSRPGTRRGKLGVFSHCPPLSFEDSTSWPIPGKSRKPYVSEEDFLEGSSQPMTVPRL